MDPIFKVIRLLMLCFFLPGMAQEVKPSGYEKRWALFHPCAALKVKKIGKACFELYNNPSLKLELDNFSNGGKLDAFRHAFFMAAFAQKIKPKKIRKLGIAHEKANYRAFRQSMLENGELPDSLDTVMDLKNNELGISLGKNNKRTDLEELKALVINEIISGKAVIMKRKKTGAYLNCENKIIDPGLFTKKWNIPKCLVASGFIYID